MSISGKVCLAGVGYTQQGIVPGKTSLQFNLEACTAAMEDVGITAKDVDGVLSFNQDGLSATRIGEALGVDSHFSLSITEGLGGYGVALAQIAASAIDEGLAHTIILTYSNIGYSVGDGPKYGQGAPRGDQAAYGLQGAPMGYALVARRHILKYGTKPEAFGNIAVAERAWANLNPRAQMGSRKMNMEDYLTSPWLAEPFRRPDCCLVSDVARAVILTTPERARNMKHRPVYVLGMGSKHRFGDHVVTKDPTVYTIHESSRIALGQSGVGWKDIDTLQLYDCFTITALESIEGLGYCKPGEGGDFIADGKLGPGGSLPTNTGGGLLSEVYGQGMVPLSEAVVQLQGRATGRQVPNCEVALVNGVGLTLQHAWTTILGVEP